jgi:putative ABC transport system permease protein
MSEVNEDVRDEPKRMRPAPAQPSSRPRHERVRVGSGVMRLEDLIRTALGAIRAHPLRSALTALGVVIGVASVVAMTSVGLGAQQRVTAAIQGLGSNLLMIQPGSFRGGGVNLGAGTRTSLTDKDMEALQKGLPDAEIVTAASNTQAQLVYEGANWPTRVEGGGVGYLDARDWKIASGRAFDEREIRQGKKIAIIGSTVERELFGGADPIGARIRIKSTPFEVVGVLQSKGQGGFFDQDDVVMAPLGAVRTRLKGRIPVVGAVDTIYVKGRSPEALAQLQNDATAILRDRHHVAAGEQDDFRVQNSASILEAGQSATQTFTLLLGAVAAVSLVVGGVGIMNIMLVAVTERTREIGLRMAVGARRSDILRQFALESTVLALAGGLVGLTLGVLTAVILAQVGGWPIAVAAWAPPVALGFSALIGVGFGAYPAYRAAELDPIEALRRD